MAADDKRSPTLDSSSDLPRSPSSPSHLTHFKPLTPDQDEPPFKSAYSSFVNLFRFSKGKCWGDGWAWVVHAVCSCKNTSERRSIMSKD